MFFFCLLNSVTSLWAPLQLSHFLVLTIKEYSQFAVIGMSDVEKKPKMHDLCGLLKK